MTTIISSIQKQLIKKGLDGIIIGSPINRRYVTGFTGTAGTAFITRETATFMTDFRYTSQAIQQAPNYEIIENRNAIVEIAKMCEDQDLQHIAFEEEYTSYKLYHQLKASIKATLIPMSGMIEQLRKIKSASEIKKIKTAASIADNAYQKILQDIQPGISEKQINDNLEMYMREEGAIASSFDIIVASGYRSALPHGVASDKLIEKGDMVTLDFGALYDGYCSDMTRTVAVGEPTSQLKEIYHIVQHALDLGIKAIRSEETCFFIDKVVRDYITEQGYGEFFGHGTGHAFGLEIHEAPYFSQKSEETIQAGMVMTVEPGIYLPGIGGVRIEDDILVTDTGYEILTYAPKKLIIL